MTLAFSKNKKEKDDYGIGIVTTVSNRLAELYRMRNEVSSNCRDLVIVKQKGLDQFIKSQFPGGLTKGRQRSLGRSYENGCIDGKKVNLSRPIKNGQQSKQLGG